MATVLAGWKKRLVLDIGTSAVRLCEISKAKTGYTLTRFVQHEFDSDPSLDEAKRKELRTEAVKSVLKQVRAPLRKVVFGVAGQSVFTRSRTLPPVPEYKVTQIVKYEIQQQIPFGLDQIAMDYQILSRNEQGGYEVMMAAIKVDVVDKALEILKPTKRGVAFVDVCPLAAYNWLKHAGEFGTQGECVAMVDIGATTTDIVIDRGGQFRFTRPLNVGGNDVTKAMAAAFNIDFSTAEKLKRERGFAPTGDPQKDGRGGEVIGQALQRLSSEIMRSFSYFRSLPGGGQVNRVVLSGGGSRLRNLVPFLHRTLGMDVRLVEPLKGLAVSPAAESVKACPEQACVILGMALRTCVPVPLEIDLIPPRVVEAARRKVQVFYWGVSITALVFSMLSVVPAARNANLQVKERIEQLKQAIRAYDPEVVQRIRVGTPPPPSGLNDQLSGWKKQLQNVQTQVNTLDKARRWRRFWLDEITFVNEARPATKGIWLSSVETSLFPEDKGNQPGAPAGAPPSPRGGGLGRAEGGNPQAGGKQGTVSLGFPGIDSRFGAVGAGPRPGAPAGGGLGGGGAAGQSRQNDEPVQAAMTLQNGLVIHGFAESDKAISEFLDELNRAVRQLPNGMFLSAEKVVFSEGSVQKVSWDILYNAPVDSGLAAGGGGGNRSGGGNFQQAAQAAQSLFSFSVEVKFRRTKNRLAPNKEQKPEQTANPAAAPPAAAPAAAPTASPAAPPTAAANSNGSAAGSNPA
jgi:type IV pilus assembly protein PilM